MERSSAKTSASGIIDDPNSINNGQEAKQRIIPESRRADGSIRKERKVRPGFTPVEDVARFVPSRVRQARAEAAAAAGVSRTCTNGIAGKAKQNSVAPNKNSTSLDTARTDSKKTIASADATLQKDSQKQPPSKTESAISKDKDIKKNESEDIPDSWDDDQSSNKDRRGKEDSVDDIVKEMQSIDIKSDK